MINFTAKEKILYFLVPFVFLSAVFFMFVRNGDNLFKPSFEDKIIGKWVVTDTKGFGGMIKEMEFLENGVCTQTMDTGLLGNLTQPTQYSINNEKVIVGGYIFRLEKNGYLVTDNLPIISFAMKKVGR